MNRKKTRPALVGAFIMLFLALVVGALTLWGSGRLFERHYRYLCNFEGSVNGLTAGSRVKFHGVPIGSVRELWIQPGPETDEASATVSVVIEIESRSIRGPQGAVEPTPEAVRRLIEHGLRAQLEIESLVTNLVYVSLDVVREAEEVEVVTSEGGLLEIPTRPSKAEALLNAIYALGEQLSELDLTGLVGSLERTSNSVGRLAKDPQIRGTLLELGASAASIRRLAFALHREVTPLGEALRSTARTATSGAANLDTVLTDIHATLTPGAPLVVDLGRTLSDLRRAARSINSLAEMVERNPSAFLVGKPQER